MDPKEYDLYDQKYEDDEELAESDYCEFVEWLIDKSGREVHAARGSSEEIRKALASFYRVGYKANLSPAELIDHLCVSSDCVLERAQLNKAEWDAILAINDSSEFKAEIGEAVAEDYIVNAPPIESCQDESSQTKFTEIGMPNAICALGDLGSRAQNMTKEELGDLVSNLAAAFVPPPEPGTPNDEPVLKWAVNQYGKLLMSTPEMARRLSGVGHPFLENFYVDKHRALMIYAADFEKAFEERPEFIRKCFNELAEVYRAEGDENAVNLFRERIESLSEQETDGAGVILDLSFPGMRIFIPTEHGHLAEKLHRKIWREIESRQLHFKDLSFSKYESCKAEPRREFSQISLSGRDQDEIEKIAFDLLRHFDWPERPYIEKAGKIEAWEADK